MHGNPTHVAAAQALLLRAAARHADGRDLAPDNLRGGAWAKTFISHVHAAIGRQ